MRIVAFDLSLTATGVADEKGWATIKPKCSGVLRLGLLQSELARAAYGADLAVIEGYSFGSTGRSLFQIGELGGVVRLMLHDAEIPFVEVSPSSVKKYATGRGNAGKAEVLIAARERLAYPGTNDNEADALWLLEMARDHYGLTEPRVPKANREALVKIDWPEVTAPTSTEVGDE